MDVSLESKSLPSVGYSRKSYLEVTSQRLARGKLVHSMVGNHLPYQVLAQVTLRYRQKEKHHTVQKGHEITSQQKGDFATLCKMLPSARSDWLVMAATSSFQLRIAHRLKHWIVDFLSFEMVINFVDYSLIQGAPAGHESADTPNGHESNGVVAGDGWIRDSGGRLVKCDTPQRKEFEVILNIMETTPEDQHSHQGRQDNLNEFRSMRDRMHPPRMSAPSCIVPPTEQLVIGPYLVPLLPTFHGMESENPYAHIKEFEDDKAKIWLNSLRPRSIRSWTDLQAEFLKKFFPTHRTNGLKRQISNFSAKENEKFYECWERYMEAINACPHHGFDTWLLVSYFYDGMSSSMKQLFETMCGGDFMSKNPEEAMDFLNYVANVSRGWDEPTKGEVGKMKSQLNAYNAKAGMYTLKEDDDMKAKLAAMTRRLEELELKEYMKCKLLLKHQCK
ncbi:hypothetical protein CK203_057736 [Vitis vinifera]|uniref:Retrotransposon gag domain-containing protein n=1 Tax=Vitis vinifera TaxID=29760 RepID=A0A438GME1_VITVI|nr:hypothetical protein CK203_057736 [Vitis vinifera]